MSNETKAQYWREHMSRWRESGLSQKAYCAQHEINLSSFGYWRKRLSSEQADGQFIPVAVQPPSSLVSITMAGAVRLEVPVALLEQVMPVLWRTLRARD